MNTKDLVIALVKPGDTVEIKPSKFLPNAERRFTIDEVTEKGFLYGCSETCDGYTMPFWAFDEIEIVK